MEVPEVPTGFVEPLDKALASSAGSALGYNCPVCGEPIYENQPTEHTNEGLAHTECCADEEGDREEGMPWGDQ